MNDKRPSNCIYPDDFAVGQTVTRRLIEMGHRRIAMFNRGESGSLESTPHYSVRDRQAGYESAMAEAGLQPVVKLFGSADAARQRGDFGYADRHLSDLAQWLSAEDAPTAVVGYGLDYGADAILAAQRAGLRVPDDLSVVVIHRANSAPTVGAIPVEAWILADARLGKAAGEAVLECTGRPGHKAPPCAIPFNHHPGATSAPLRNG